MVDQSDEYNSLRSEIIQHQNRRDQLMNLGLTASIALLGIGSQLQNPFIPLLTLLLVFLVRVQLTQIQFGIERIATYIRVAIESDNPALRWETISYEMRSLERSGRIGLKVSSAVAINGILTLVGLSSVILAFVFSNWDPLGVGIALVAGLTWLIVWIVYGAAHKRQALENINVVEDVFKKIRAESGQASE